MDLHQIELLLATAIVAAVPLLVAGLGELVTERSGVLNLGVEGMMLMGAVGGYIVTVLSGDQWCGLIAGAAVGALISMIFAFLALVMLASQVAAGLAMSLLGMGLSAYIGQSYTSATIKQTIAVWPIPVLSKLPVIGNALFNQTPVVYLAVALCLAVYYFLYKTRAGLILRATGESAEVAHAMGFPVLLVRFSAILFGGAMAGLAGAYYSVVYLRLWQEQMTGGLGWIALGLVVFSTWRPERLLAGSLIFGILMALQFRLQMTTLAIPTSLLAVLPYIATIAVMVLISRDKNVMKRNAPASLGKVFFPGA